MTASAFSLNATFAVELAVFAVVLAVLARFVIKPLQAAMRRRQAEIDESMAQARRVEERLAAAEADYEETLTRARREARSIIETARRVADHTAGRTAAGDEVGSNHPVAGRTDRTGIDRSAADRPDADRTDADCTDADRTDADHANAGRPVGGPVR